VRPNYCFRSSIVMHKFSSTLKDQVSLKQFQSAFLTPF
jgi:hypothetical protein